MSHSPPLLLHVFPSFAVGGAQVRFAALANRFADRWQHAVIALNGETGCAERIAADVPFRLIASPVRHGEGLLRAVPRIGTLLRELRPALLVTSNWGSIEWAIANRLSPRLPHLHTEDGFGPEESAGQLPRRVWTRRLVLRSSTVVLPSLTLLRVATTQWRLPTARLHHIPNGLDLTRFKPEGEVPELDLIGDGPVVGCVAALRPEKNLARLLHAVAILRHKGVPLRLLVIGDGPERDRLLSLVSELEIGGSVRFAGAIADPAAAYRAMDVFCLPSDTEQMPFSVLEAMATGLPVAATDVGDVRAMLASENLSSLTPRDAPALAQALEALLLDPDGRARIGRANLAKARLDYDQEAMFRSFAALIESGIDAGR